MRFARTWLGGSIVLCVALAGACATSTSDTNTNPPTPDGGHASLPDGGVNLDGAVAEDGSDDASLPIADASDAAADTTVTPDAADAAIPDANVEDADHSAIPVGATLGTCDRSKWTMLASDSHAVMPIAYAVDSLPPTRWSTGVPQTPGEYLQVDFGGYVVLDSLSFDNSFTTTDQGDYARAFDVLASDDGTTFTKHVASADFTSVAPGAVATVSFAKYATRAVRVTLNAASGSWWSVHELNAGCVVPPPAVDAGEDASDDAGEASAPDADAAPDPDAGTDAASDAASDATTTPVPLDRTAWVATASNTNGADPIANAFDGNPSTRWATGKLQFGDEWFRIDMGAITTIRQIVLDSNATDYPSAYQLEVSTDDVNYTLVATGLGAPGTQIAFAPRDARYVRIKQIGSGYDKWWCIYEANVYR